jgi:hypothetical protein
VARKTEDIERALDFGLYPPVSDDLDTAIPKIPLLVLSDFLLEQDKDIDLE